MKDINTDRLQRENSFLIDLLSDDQKHKFNNFLSGTPVEAFSKSVNLPK